MRYKFEVKKWLHNKRDFIIEIQKDKLDLWYKEQMRRFWVLCKLEKEEDKQIYIKANPVFDIDESYELWIMSPEHFEAMDNYLFKI